MCKLREAGFVPYLTTIGGSGLGALSSGESVGAVTDGFSTKDREELAEWVENRQGWLYV